MQLHLRLIKLYQKITVYRAWCVQECVEIFIYDDWSLYHIVYNKSILMNSVTFTLLYTSYFTYTLTWAIYMRLPKLLKPVITIFPSLSNMYQPPSLAQT